MLGNIWNILMLYATLVYKESCVNAHKTMIDQCQHNGMIIVFLHLFILRLWKL